MKIRLHILQIIGAILFALLASASEAAASECWVVPNTSQCAANTTTNPCYTTLKDAVANASVCNTIKILPNSVAYPADNITISQNITIYGVETARTFITGNGSTAITVSGVNSTTMEIRNLTFTSASPGILVQNSSFNIKNNIFEVGNTTAAIQVADISSSPSIVNNTFYQNGTAILSTQNTLSIINNIFNGNALAISTNVVKDQIKNNLFFQNTTIGGPTDMVLNNPLNPDSNYDNPDPQFVDPSDSVITNRDFHLMSKPTVTGNTISGSNSIDGASPPDVGAYGGSSSDTIPFPVSGLTGTATSSTSMDLTWSLNECYMIQGYKIFYSANKSGASYDTTLDAGNVASFPYVLGPLTPPSPPNMNKPVLTSSPESGALVLTWTPSSGATGYNIFYKEHTASTYNTPISVGDVTTYTLSGLTNPTPQGTVTEYDVYIQPYYQVIYYVAVKPYYNSTDANKLALAYSNEISVPLGTPTDGPASDTITDYPEPLLGYPDLPDKGCFIATAAYGYYSAPQVRALREFRDRYLLTNGPGRAFVQWYYRHSPAAARFINDHSWLKPVVRGALMPAVAGAMFMTRASLLVKVVIFLTFGLLIFYVLRRTWNQNPGTAKARRAQRVYYL